MKSLHQALNFFLDKAILFLISVVFIFVMTSSADANNLGMSTPKKLSLITPKGTGNDNNGGNNGGGKQLKTTMTCANPIWKEADFNSVYHVGPGQTYTTPNDVPWEDITPSSLIKIHWRAEAYRNKWVINTNATQQEPVIVLGVPDNGRLPVISGENATTRLALDYWNEGRSLIKIGAASIPRGNNAAYITVACLDLKSAKPNYSFKNDSGSTSSYSSNAAAIHIEQGEYISIRNNAIHDASNGIFSTSQTANILISSNHIWDNGINGSIYQHNSYTESLGITFEYNYYGPLCSGCLGNNLKDRSAGTVIRYNWIEDGNRQLDLVESDYATFVNNPLYRTTYVYGNLLTEHEGQGNRQIVHYGGDGGDRSMYRKGTLYFFHNTIYSDRSRNTLFALSSNDENVDMRNNIIAGADFAILDSKGIVNMTNNWLTSGWVNSHSSLIGSVNASGTIQGLDAGFSNISSNNFYLKSGAGAIGQAGSLSNSSHPILWEFKIPSNGIERDSNDDLGAFNF
ncbi:polysaccharide-degrading enzyme [sulfur-oxidizing endosymbiont of Gigantopelta aegis]|uniref:polysaccharide-degrading enzyme n=1 Tax=sulfur-oxidizing endosymbiont of Gigantopelta aegis TaxID=2794934 RepID=UPI0018DC848C|nr:polysaccharide-degrading enzyme [sulfur-oxidizing endosymbiont of Gigantopelta aegis]